LIDKELETLKVKKWLKTGSEPIFGR
jgi:hypothetical protein